MPHRIIVATDVSIARQGIVTMLAHESRLQVIAEVEDGPTAVIACRDLRPDLLVLALRQPPHADLAVTRLLAADRCGPRILILSMNDKPAALQAALDVGARACLPITIGATELHYAIEHVLAGEPLVSGVDARSTQCAVGLGLQEQAILSKVALGLPNKAIAQQQGISVRTVGSHLQHIFRKLGASNRMEAVLLARQQGLLRSE